MNLRPTEQRPRPGAVLFICDGLSADLVDEGCRDGWLPNIQKRLVAGGLRVENAITEFPAITYAVLTTFATGVSPARHHITGNAWFDRQQVLFRDYMTIDTYAAVNEDFWQPTIYEYLSPRYTTSIQNAIHRGVTVNLANWAVSGVMWYFGDYTAVDKLTATTVETVAANARSRHRWPDLLTCYFPGVDSVGHEFGVRSPRYRSAVQHFDYQFGRICNWLERQKLLDTTYIVLVSDHGLAHVDNHNVVDLMPYWRDVLGLNVTAQPMQADDATARRRHFAAFDAVYVPSAIRWATLHLKGSAGWSVPPSPAEVRSRLEKAPAGRRIWDLPGIDAVAIPLPGNDIEVRSRAGAAIIRELAGSEGPEYSYEPQSGDVLGYLGDSRLARFVEAGPHSSREWLNATADHEYPNVVPNLPALLRSHRVGQVVVFADMNYSFGAERSGHGGIRRADLRIPLMIAGPGVAQGRTLPAARAADVVPTLLHLLGVRTPQGTFDGISLISESHMNAHAGVGIQ